MTQDSKLREHPQEEQQVEKTPARGAQSKESTCRSSIQLRENLQQEPKEREHLQDEPKVETTPAKGSQRGVNICKMSSKLIDHLQ